jgi:hypothetical protein
MTRTATIPKRAVSSGFLQAGVGGIVEEAEGVAFGGGDLAGQADGQIGQRLVGAIAAEGRNIASSDRNDAAPPAPVFAATQIPFETGPLSRSCKIRAGFTL